MYRGTLYYSPAVLPEALRVQTLVRINGGDIQLCQADTYIRSLDRDGDIRVDRWLLVEESTGDTSASIHLASCVIMRGMCALAALERNIIKLGYKQSYC